MLLKDSLLVYLSDNFWLSSSKSNSHFNAFGQFAVSLKFQLKTFILSKVYTINHTLKHFTFFVKMS